jgi:hypothetical protein
VDAGFRFLLYSAYWALPPQNLFTDYDWVSSTFLIPPDFPPFLARIAANESAAFHAEIANRTLAWGGVGIEIDWMMRNTQPFADFQTQAGLIEQWYAGVAGAMGDRGLVWQQVRRSELRLLSYHLLARLECCSASPGLATC